MKKLSMSDLEKLLKAKEHSDKKEYDPKTKILRDMAKKDPKAFFVDSDKGGIVGLTHRKFNFRIHLPKEKTHDLKLEKKGYVPLMVKDAMVHAEIADTPSQMVRGLSGRYFLPINQGMLFTKAGSYWMKDTYVPLDLVFLTKEGRVIDVQEMPVERNPKAPSKLYSCRGTIKPAMALELPRGWCRRNGVEAGDCVTVAQ